MNKSLILTNKITILNSKGDLVNKNSNLIEEFYLSQEKDIYNDKETYMKLNETENNLTRYNINNDYTKELNFKSINNSNDSNNTTNLIVNKFKKKFYSNNCLINLKEIKRIKVNNNNNNNNINNLFLL